MCVSVHVCMFVYKAVFMVFCVSRCANDREREREFECESGEPEVEPRCGQKREESCSDPPHFILLSDRIRFKCRSLSARLTHLPAAPLH